MFLRCFGVRHPIHAVTRGRVNKPHHRTQRNPDLKPNPFEPTYFSVLPQLQPAHWCAVPSNHPPDEPLRHNTTQPDRPQHSHNQLMAPQPKIIPSNGRNGVSGPRWVFSEVFWGAKAPRCCCTTPMVAVPCRMAGEMPKSEHLRVQRLEDKVKVPALGQQIAQHGPKRGFDWHSAHGCGLWWSICRSLYDCPNDAASSPSGKGIG